MASIYGGQWNQEAHPTPLETRPCGRLRLHTNDPGNRLINTGGQEVPGSNPGSPTSTSRAFKLMPTTVTVCYSHVYRLYATNWGERARIVVAG